MVETSPQAVESGMAWEVVRMIRCRVNKLLITNIKMMNTGDSAWVLVATAMVMLMTPAGLALFYGGLSRKKSVINTVGMTYVAFCVATLVWVIAGYSIAFGEGGLLGSAEHLFLNGISISDLTGSIPELLFVSFQGVFAAIAVAIISGSVVERMRFSNWILFSALWVLFIYSPLVRAIWGEGFLSHIGELDFAGGTVIHVNAGVAGLVLALLLGKRTNPTPTEPSSTKLTLLGSALLWFGWYGFNAGSQLAADSIAANAFLVTSIAACAGGLAWIFAEWRKGGNPTILGLATGVISGLVGITPAAGYVNGEAALIIGVLSGLIGYYGVFKLKKLWRYDDTLDAFGIHGLVGIWGALATGIFANPEVNDATGLLYGNPGQMIPQLIAVVVTVIVSGVGTAILYKVSCMVTGGARIDSDTEQNGMDHAYHRESSFSAEYEINSNK